MFSVCTTRNNAIAYLLWRWVFRNFGGTVAWLDKFYFGSTRGMNDYEALASSYRNSNVKPDKQYSILPTVLNMVGDCEGKNVIDLGCGAGFFTLPLAQSGAAVVCGVDNSPAQIELAKKVSAHPSIAYRVGDIFTQHGRPVEIITAPFVANYARTVPVLMHFFGLVFKSLREGGRAVFVIDLPNGRSLKRFGATKAFDGPAADETPIRINLFNEDKRICTLVGVYYTPQTVEALLLKVGFRKVTWHKPVVSEEGISKLGPGFWEGYIDDPELGYLTAEK
ncbi:MAG: toxoflavin synthase [Patescibacteria group bacterium]|nr:toxoflavin synthase [Patescibacteria group bacterium]